MKAVVLRLALNEIKNLRNMMPLEEKHLDQKMLPFVREHAVGMMKDIGNLAEKVKRGELDLQDVRNILVIERDLLDRTHEAIERIIGNPEKSHGKQESM
ncbi:hypothetical protein [Thermococcus barophilus]|uniref:hypothetical protein n=1 Tax=Thermococcus barophilus TaxID=55802 RepID=UPI0011AE943B|nr:hypothetical protein [Thermococcus barophilus]